MSYNVLLLTWFITALQITTGQFPDSNQTYKPVVIIHGIAASASSLRFFGDYIIKRHPGTQVTLIDRFNDLFSFTEMWKQVDQIRRDISKICQENPNGIHLIGYSQGGLIGRGVVETLPNHTINNFISMAAPQNGQYGDNWILTAFMYSAIGQLISVGGYWKDPNHLDEYLKHSTFLPILNCEVKHDRCAEFKKNFLTVKKMVLIGSENDGSITPWQSTQFGCYDKNKVVVLMNDQEFYKNDSFGLRSLHDRGDLVLETVSGVTHANFEKNITVIENHILPWLD